MAVKRGKTPGAGRTTGEIVRGNNKWRENYNPLRSLVLSRVVQLLEAGERGEFADLQWLYRFVEKRFPVLRSLVTRRKSAITKLTWEVKTVSEFPQAKTKREKKKWEKMAGAQADFLRWQYESVKNMRKAIAFLALAEFRGYSILQKHRGRDGRVKELHWLPQWNFVRDGLYGEFFWNPDAASMSADGMAEEHRIPSDPEDAIRQEFLIREVDMPINEIGVIAFVRSNLSQKDWDAFVEMFGLPGCVVVMPSDIPQGKEEEYKAAAQRVAEGASGAIPNGADAKFPTNSVRGTAPFREHLEWQEKDVVLAGTGGKLTMLTGPTGLGGGQAEVHQDVFDEIATAEAAEISEIFQEQFDQVELAKAFPGEPVLAYLEICPVDDTADKTLQFKREVFKQWQTDGTVSDVLANQTDLKRLTEDVALPVNEEYVDPYLPVVADGVPVTGDLARDSKGDVIGAVWKQQTSPNPMAEQPAPGKDNEPVPTPENPEKPDEDTEDTEDPEDKEETEQ